MEEAAVSLWRQLEDLAMRTALGVVLSQKAPSRGLNQAITLVLQMVLIQRGTQAPTEV